MSVSITFGDLWAYSGELSDERVSLSELPADGRAHIHGRLELSIHGRLLPHLGFFGADDVCFNTWLSELRTAAKRLSQSDRSEHVFDEGEQGQPAFTFERRGVSVYVTVAESLLGGGQADLDWQQVECKFDEFVDAIRHFETALRSAVLSQAPTAGEAWFHHLQDDAA
jgi:hypothetical protein